MSADPSLKRKSALVRHRNVLNRAERIERLKEEERWQEGDSLFGLPKVANRKVSVGKKEAKAKVEGEAAVLDQAATQPGAAAGKAAVPAGKAAAPAGKAAAPASKTAAAPSKAAGASKSTGQGKPGGGGRR